MAARRLTVDVRPRPVLVWDDGDRIQLSPSSYAALVQLVRNADSLGLTTEAVFWSAAVIPKKPRPC